MHTLGIDLHKHTSSWVLIDDQYRTLWKEAVACHPDHISKTLNGLPVSPDQIKVAIEPVCGWRWVSDLLEQSGMEVHIAHPLKVQLIAQSTKKYDEGDARTLASLLQSGYFPEAHKAKEEIYRLRLLLRERTFLVSMRTRAKNRLHGIATAGGFLGNPLHKQKKVAILSGEHVVLKELHGLIDELGKRIHALDPRLAEEEKRHPQTTLLMTMPGIGLITALTVIAEVDDFNRFPSGKHLSSYAGLVPRQRSSGDKVRFGSITNQGSSILRTAMVETAMRVNKKRSPELFAFIERLAPVCGAKRARVALARKMLVILWNMVRTQTPYDSSKPLSSSGTANKSELDS